MGDRGQGEDGASLLGVVTVLVILGALAGLTVLAVTKLAYDPVATSTRLGGLTPSGGLVESGPSTVTAQPRSLADSASTSACQTNVRAVEAAAAAKHAADGRFPAAMSDLVAGGWLEEAPVIRGYELTLHTAGGRPTGKVLVNGLPADQGCAAPRAG